MVKSGQVIHSLANGAPGSRLTLKSAASPSSPS